MRKYKWFIMVFFCLLLTVEVFAWVFPSTDEKNNPSGEEAEKPSEMDMEKLKVVQSELEKVWSGYMPDDAANDGCVVFEGKEVISGHQIWLDFVSASERGENSQVWIYKGEPDSPSYSVETVIYKGKQFWRCYLSTFPEGNDPQMITNSFSYLIHDTNSTGQSGITEWYLLSDCKEITLEEYFNSFLSSLIGNNCNAYLVYAIYE